MGLKCVPIGLLCLVAIFKPFVIGASNRNPDPLDADLSDGDDGESFHFQNETQPQTVRVAFVTFDSEVAAAARTLRSSSGLHSLEILGEPPSLATPDYQVFAYVQDSANFTATFHPANTWAYFNSSTRTWDGMGGIVQRGEADYTANAGYMLPERVGSFRFLATGYKNKLSAYFRVPPRTLDGYSDVIWRPFAQIWMPLVGFLVLVASLLKVVFHLPVSDALTVTIGNFSQQGTTTNTLRQPDANVSSGSIRLFLLVICTSFYVINDHVAASLISKFTSQYRTISSLQDLVDEGYEFGVLEDSYLRTSYGGSSELYNGGNQVLARAMDRPMYVNLSMGLQMAITNQKFALLTEIDVHDAFESITSSSSDATATGTGLFCDLLREMVVEDRPMWSSQFVRKGSDLSNKINVAMIGMWANGNAKRAWKWQEQAQANARPSCQNVVDGTIHITQVKSPCLIFVAGAFISVACYGLEFLTHSKHTLC